MHAPKPVNWAAAAAEYRDRRDVHTVLSALLGVHPTQDMALDEWRAAIQSALDEQRYPDMTIHARHCGAFVFRGPNATEEQAYESLRDVAERALPDDPPMHEINGRLRRELDESEVRHRDEVHALRREVEDWRALAHQAEAKLREVREELAGLVPTVPREPR